MSTHKMVNGVQVPLTQDEIDEMAAREAAHNARVAEEKATEYKRRRAKAYPAIGEQLDILYHEGIEGFRTAIKAVKDKYPKPTE